jgi:rootletin
LLCQVNAEKQSIQERASNLQRTITSMETEKRDVERSALRLEKDRSALKKTLDKVRGGGERGEVGEDVETV